MNKQFSGLIIIVALVLSFSAIASARSIIRIKPSKSYLLYDKNTLEVISLSNEDDAVLQPGQIKVIIDKPIWKLGLTKHPTYYKYVNGDFILNTEKITAEYDAKQAAQARIQKIRADRESAKTKLIGLGLTADEASSLIK